MHNKINNIQALRAFAVLLVVTLHIVAIEFKYSQHEVFLSGLLRLGLSGVDLFFIISGFIMVTITQDHQIKTSGDFHKISPQKFLASRFSRIFPLYWVVSGLILLVYWFDSSLVNLQ